MDKEKVEQQLFSRNVQKFGFDLNPIVFIGSGIIIIIFSVYALINLDRANKLINLLNDYIVTTFNWVFILSSVFFIS